MVNAGLEVQRAIEAGKRIADRAIRVRRGGQATGGGQAVEVTGADMGRLVANPSAFWAAACAVRIGDKDAVEAMAAGCRMTAAQLAAGDFGQVTEALVGQAVWLGVLAVELAGEASGEKGEDADRKMRLALAAQRQAAQTLASAAALTKLSAQGANAVEILD